MKRASGLSPTSTSSPRSICTPNTPTGSSPTRMAANPTGRGCPTRPRTSCASSPYLDAYFLPLLGEAIRRHCPDAVWLDAGSWSIDTPCWCDHCARLFRERAGRALLVHAPAAPDKLEDEGWIAWRLWRRGHIGACIRTLVAAAKAADPAVLVADNCLGRFSVCVPEFPDGRSGCWVSATELGGRLSLLQPGCPGRQPRADHQRCVVFSRTCCPHVSIE